MNHELCNRDLDQFVELVRTSLRAGHVPLDPLFTEEEKALKREFPEECWRWDPPKDVRDRLSETNPPQFDEDWEEKFLSTVFANPSRYGRVFWHVISKWMQTRGT
jgi:hypothetical protein